MFISWDSLILLKKHCALGYLSFIRSTHTLWIKLCSKNEITKTGIYIFQRGCLCDNWKASFLPRLIFNWRTFSRRVTARWSCGWGKNQVKTNQNSRNCWSLIARQTICKRAFRKFVFIDEFLLSISSCWQILQSSQGFFLWSESLLKIMTSI